VKPGDLVRIQVPSTAGSWFFPHNGKVGMVIRPDKRGPFDVWWILLEGGAMLNFEPTSLRVINEAG
jgi:hypothetical protein